MIVYDHTKGRWAKSYARLTRTNGAFTYSRDICKWHLPIWREVLGKTDSVATAGMVPGVTVQYLHERTVPRLDTDTRLFVTAHRDLALILGRRGLWIPNLIDANTLPAHEPSRAGWVYFGNTLAPKRGKHFEFVRSQMAEVVSGDRDQARSLRRVSKYRYGVGVARCAMEMMAMGLKVMIFGEHHGGLVLNDDDFAKQRSANFSSFVTTGCATIAESMARVEEGVAGPVTFQDAMPEVAEIIRGVRL